MRLKKIFLRLMRFTKLLIETDVKILMVDIACFYRKVCTGKRYLLSSFPRWRNIIVIGLAKIFIEKFSGPWICLIPQEMKSDFCLCDR